MNLLTRQGGPRETIVGISATPARYQQWLVLHDSPMVVQDF
ncbi:MAG: hypothetical protein ACI8WM_001877 [Burkholderiaceae bacterium]|jgi:hypothetical protein